MPTPNEENCSILKSKNFEKRFNELVEISNKANKLMTPNEEVIKLKNKLLKQLQKEGDTLNRPFKYQGSYDEGYWDGLKFGAFLIKEQFEKLYGE